MTTLRRIDKCNDCSGPVMSAELTSGRTIRVDAEPIEDGKIVLYDGPGSGKLFALTTAKSRAKASELYQLHRCPMPEPKTGSRRRPKGLRKTMP